MSDIHSRLFFCLSASRAACLPHRPAISPMVAASAVLRAVPLFFALALSACAATPDISVPGQSQTNAVSAMDFRVPQISEKAIRAGRQRRLIDDPTGEEPGTIVVDLPARALFLVMPDGKAMRYRIDPLTVESTQSRGTPYSLDAAAPDRWAFSDANGSASALGALIRMNNRNDAEDLHKRLSPGAKVVVRSPQGRTTKDSIP